MRTYRVTVDEGVLAHLPRLCKGVWYSNYPYCPSRITGAMEIVAENGDVVSLTCNLQTATKEGDALRGESIIAQVVDGQIMRILDSIPGGGILWERHPARKHPPTEQEREAAKKFHYMPGMMCYRGRLWQRDGYISEPMSALSFEDPATVRLMELQKDLGRTAKEWLTLSEAARQGLASGCRERALRLVLMGEME